MTVMSSIRMAIRVILFLTLFTVMCIADFKEYYTSSCPCVPRNLALRAKAVQSSTFDHLGAENSVDGNRNSNYNGRLCSHTNEDKDPWWRVDLLDVYEVTRVIITNCGNCCEKTINGIQIRIGNSLENNGSNNELALTIESIPLGVTKTFEFMPIRGRYVNILVPGPNEYLTLCEVEVFAEKNTPSYTCFPRNLALGAKAVQSSTYEQLGAVNAVDGNRDPYYKGKSCSHTNGDKDPWWRVDLLDVYKVSSVSITNRGDCCEERINGSQIRIGNSLENNGNNNELAATVESIPRRVTKTFEFMPIRGRYVNILVPGRNEYLTLCEVEVFAEKKTPLYNCFPRNLALGAKAVQSSTFDHLGAENAVDGNRNSNYMGRSCSHTNRDKDPWWRVDLLDVYKVTRVIITNCGDYCEKRIKGIQIRIGNSLENNGNNNELAATIESIPRGVTKTFVFKPIRGRYVNILVPGRKDYLTLCEVEVFADYLD